MLALGLTFLCGALAHFWIRRPYLKRLISVLSTFGTLRQILEHIFGNETFKHCVMSFANCVVHAASHSLEGDNACQQLTSVTIHSQTQKKTISKPSAPMLLRNKPFKLMARLITHTRDAENKPPYIWAFSKHMSSIECKSYCAYDWDANASLEGKQQVQVLWPPSTLQHKCSRIPKHLSQSSRAHCHLSSIIHTWDWACISTVIRDGVRSCQKLHQTTLHQIF